MASPSIPYESTEELSNEEKATLDKLIKQAESEDIEAQAVGVVVENEGLDKAATVDLRLLMTVGALSNLTKGSLSVLKTQKWAGHIVKNYKNPLSSVDAFAMGAIQNKGNKAAVVYFGKNKVGVDCAWLLAFADTTDLGRKIYAECGVKSKFDSIDWGEVEQRLNDGGPLILASDKETGTRVCATIVGTGGKSAVASAFSG